MNEQRRPIALITGASSGIGKSAAKSLLDKGWHVIAQGRDRARSEIAEAELRASMPTSARLDMIRANLSEMGDVVRLAEAVLELTPSLNRVMNNAGGISAEQASTPDGFETTFAGNHLGHFLLNEKLLPLLINTARCQNGYGVRIINTSSAGHFSALPINWDDIQCADQWNSAQAYCTVKLYNILFANELSKRFAKDGIRACSFHPGSIGSNFASHGDAAMQSYMASQNLESSEDGADTLVWLASAPDQELGDAQYFYKRQPSPMSPQARDEVAANKLWTLSEQLLRKAGY